MASVDPSIADLLEQVLELYEAEPWVLLVTALASAVVIGGFLALITWAIYRSGSLSPPRQVLIIVTALIGLMSILGVIIRPDVDALAVAAGAAIGALAGALATSFTPTGLQAADEDEPSDG